ncbi:hypothetical protein NQ317_008607, partial [Molorchus minor]
MWYLIRKFRLTASNFGAILSCYKRNKFTESLFKTLIALTVKYIQFGWNKAIQWGKSHEKNGIDFLKTNLRLDVQATGIWLSSSGLLGASPDGLVGDDGIRRVKLKNSDKYIIFYNDSGEIVVNMNHNYYHQIQGNLHILNRSKCYLCIWTLKEYKLIRVKVDTSSHKRRFFQSYEKFLTLNLWILKIDPGYALLTKVMTPFGATPTKTFH